MLMKLCSYIFYIIKHMWWTFLKNLSSRFEDFWKKPIIQNYPKFAIIVTARKNLKLEIAENKINEIFTAQRDKLNTHFDSNLIYFINRVFVSTIKILIIKKLRFKNNCKIFEIKHTEFFYSWIFHLQDTKVLNIGISFYPSNLIRVKFKLISWFNV